MQATLETFGKVHRSKDGKRWHPCQDPLFFAPIQTVQACESPISLGWQETRVLTPWRWGGWWGACQLQSMLWVTQPYLRQREDSGEEETAAVQMQISAGFPPFQNFVC